MSGTLEIRENVAWMPAKWIYDGILELLVPEIAVTDDDLASRISRGMTTISGYCDIRDLGTDRFVLLLSSARKVRHRLLLEGPSSFSKEDQFQVFIKQLDALIDMLTNDTRSA